MNEKEKKGLAFASLNDIGPGRNPQWIILLYRDRSLRDFMGWWLHNEKGNCRNPAMRTAEYRAERMKELGYHPLILRIEDLKHICSKEAKKETL